MTIEPKSAFKIGTISLAASGVGCTRLLDGGQGLAYQCDVLSHTTRNNGNYVCLLHNIDAYTQAGQGMMCSFDEISVDRKVGKCDGYFCGWMFCLPQNH
jgi:hypothetical protein